MRNVSISISTATYRRLKAYAIATGTPMAHVVESLFVDLPDPPALPPPTPELDADTFEPGPTKSTVNMKVSDELHTRIFEVAFNERTTMPVVISSAIDRMLDSLGAPKARKQ